MKRSLAKFAAAAATIVVALISISYFGGSLDGTSVVYAAAIKALQDVKTVHISGWTTCLRPHIRDELLDTSKRNTIEIDARHTKPGMDFSSNPHSIKHLLESFTYYQGYNLRADQIVVVDETGLSSEPGEGRSEEDVAVSSASPYWRGTESIEIAREWFKEQFGVKFAEEIRPMTVHVVRKSH